MVFMVCGLPFISKAQAKKQTLIKKNVPQQPAKNKVATGIIRTNNADTLYFDVDNAIILTADSKQKIEYYIKATDGEINKLTKNFYQLGNLKENNVTVTVFDKATDKLVETKKFVVAIQKLPF